MQALKEADTSFRSMGVTEIRQSLFSEAVHAKETYMSFDIIRRTVRNIVNLISTKQYELALQACSKSRLTSADIGGVIETYGRNTVCSPANADRYIDVVAIKGCSEPTWSVMAPIWTLEEGRSDLTLDLTIIMKSSHPDVELNDLKVM